MKTAKNTPRTLTDFRKLGKRRCADPDAAKQLHDRREESRDESYTGSFAVWIKNRRKWLFTPPNCALIPLGGLNPAYDWGRKQNVTSPQAGLTPTHPETLDLGKYSSRCNYTHYEYRLVVESFGRVCFDGRELYVRIDGTAKRLRAPKGWRWQIDRNGIGISNGRDDFHPTAREISEGMAVRQMVGGAIRNGKTRRAAQRAAKLDAQRKIDVIKRAEREGAMVLVDDSRAAGNCLAGTLNWMQSHGLKDAKFVPPSMLLKIANGDASRIAVVVAAALRRHAAQMRDGYCVLTK
jgi:hypothetical protein